MSSEWEQPHGLLQVLCGHCKKSSVLEVHPRLFIKIGILGNEKPELYATCI